jgi:hypothetical protein
VKGVGDQAGVLAGGDSPAQDPAGEHVDDERDIDEPGQGPYIREVRNPQLVGPSRRLPGPFHQVGVPRRRPIRAGRDGAVLPADRASDPGQPHQPTHLVPADVQARAAGRVPHLPDPVDPPVVPPQRDEFVGEVGASAHSASVNGAIVRA